MSEQHSKTTKPTLNFWQIWNMCFGFMGIQFGFALQNSNVSRIFQTLGADYGNMALLWVAAPITGLIIQPIIGHMSDNTWGKLGRSCARMALSWCASCPLPAPSWGQLGPTWACLGP